jgi:hypothetical protein
VRESPDLLEGKKPVSQTLEMDSLLREAKLFRAALEATAFDGQDGNLKIFPRQCCDHASTLFGMYLIQSGYGPSKKVVAERRDAGLCRHVWLLYQGMIVDLTGDQFQDESQPKVIVTRNSEWHEAWEPVATETRVIDEPYRNRMHGGWYGSRYERVCVAMNRLKGIAEPSVGEDSR